MTAVEVARDVFDRAVRRKEEIEAEGPVSDILWQYCSGVIEGARRVVRALEAADQRETGGSLPAAAASTSTGEGSEEGPSSPVLNKSGGRSVEEIVEEMTRVCSCPPPVVLDVERPIYCARCGCLVDDNTGNEGHPDFNEEV